MENSFSTSTNQSSYYLKSLAKDFDNKTKFQGVLFLPEKSEKKENLSINNSPKENNKINFDYYSGILATIGQAVAGLLMIPAAFITKSENNTTKLKIEKLLENHTNTEEKNKIKKIIKESDKNENIYQSLKPLINEKEEQEIEKIITKYGNKSLLSRFGKWLNKKDQLNSLANKIFKNEEKFHLLGKKLNRIGWFAMGASYFVSMPSCIGAALKAAQPSMLTGSFLWGISALLMMNKKYENSARILAFTPFGAGFIYAGLANKVKNDNELKKDDKPRTFDFNGINKNTLWSKAVNFIKFIKDDLLSLPKAGLKAVSQGFNYITGKRKERPEFWTVIPTENNSKLASLLLFPGGLLLMTFGRKYKPVEKAANVLIGIGLLFEALYMFTLGNSKKGADKSLILTGVPLRAIGDFGQTNPIMLGMRTLGGASFEYYFALLNKEKIKKSEDKSG